MMAYLFASSCVCCRRCSRRPRGT